MDNIKLIEAVKAAQAGDQAALTRIYLEYAKSVYYLALKLMKGKETAEDITQEVFIYVYQKITELREPGAFRAWLNRITASKCANALTRSREPLSIDIEEVAETDFLEEADPLLVPEKAFDNTETARMIVDIIDALPTPQRVCVYYYYYEQLTIAQIAEVLDANENTVKSRLALARDKIRKELERLNKEEGIKLYSAVPLILSPILKMSLQEFDMPQSVLTGMLDRVTAKVSVNTGTTAVQQAANTATQAVPSTAAEATLTNAAAGKGLVGGLGIGAKIAIAVAGVVVTAGVVFGAVSAVSSWNNSVPTIAQEEYARAVEENTVLRKRLAESAKSAVSSDQSQGQPEEDAMPEPQPEPAPEVVVSDGIAPTLIGTWEYPYTHRSGQTSIYTTTYNDDGTAYFGPGGLGYRDLSPFEGTYRISENRLIISVEGTEIYNCECRISGNNGDTLAMVDGDSERIYTRRRPGGFDPAIVGTWEYYILYDSGESKTVTFRYDEDGNIYSWSDDPSLIFNEAAYWTGENKITTYDIDGYEMSTTEYSVQGDTFTIVFDQGERVLTRQNPDKRTDPALIGTWQARYREYGMPDKLTYNKDGTYIHYNYDGTVYSEGEFRNYGDGIFTYDYGASEGSQNTGSSLYSVSGDVLEYGGGMLYDRVNQ